MSMNKAVLAIAVSCAIAGGAMAQDDHYIRLTVSEDTRYLYNAENPVFTDPYVFKGGVSEKCRFVRVIWAQKSEDVINDYLLNGKKPRDARIDDYVLSKFKAGDRTFEYNVNYTLDNVGWGSNYYRFIAKFADGTYKSVSATLYVEKGGGAERAKPVIYLYPAKEQTIKVSVKPVGGVTVSKPDYGKGWKVKASPDGTITDAKSGEKYPYLFWESKDSEGQIDMSKGFVTPIKDIAAFFEQKLDALGLNQKEIADFNEYWVPAIEREGKPYVFVHFYDMAEIEKEAPIATSPKYDSIIRVYFDHIGLDEPIETEAQELKAAERKGFAVVEWGGRRYNKAGE